MSAIYDLEPPTSGRVLFTTSHGPLDLHLWPQESPQTTRNFLQHVLNGYYNDLPFHRIVPQTLAQTGDPTRTGDGGVAALAPHGQGIPRETHSRLKFRRRGIAAMVADEEGRVRSQFFFTLGKAEWLDGGHSIFGCVKGESLFNLVAMGDIEVNGFDAEGGPRVLKVEIVENPFDGMVRQLSGARTGHAVGDKKAGKKGSVTAKRAVKSARLLSFMDEDGSDSETQPTQRRKPVNKRPRGIGITAKTTGKKEKDHTKAGAPQEKDSRKKDDDDIIRKANEEFERLKAQLTGAVASSITKDETAGIQHASKARDTTTPRLDAASLTPGKAERASEIGAGKRRAESGVAGGGVGSSMIEGGVRKRRRGVDENAMLSRLAQFERSLTLSRRAAKEGGTVGGRGDWFVKALQLGSAAGGGGGEEYEVRVGGRREGKGEAGRRR
eukprot:GFKZ01002923.1.p1 GENE.GFKZ01002923.1~~GFKZ01002923.1.p1  ORF type:complete len:460 (-),score=58.93 GFKZ01002923.1:428-1744(-)